MRPSLEFCSTQGFPPRHGGAWVLGCDQRLADWSHAPPRASLMFPVAADLGRGRGGCLLAQQGPSLRPGHRFAAGPQGSRANRCPDGAMRRPCPGVTNGVWCGYTVRVLDADMTAVAQLEQKDAKACATSRIALVVGSSGTPRLPTPEPSRANSLACHCQCQGVCCALVPRGTSTGEGD
jgi:hypothetical protein